MMFHTIAFILAFLPVCLTGFFVLGRFRGPTWALCWLVGSSLFFYAWWNPEHLPLLLGSVVVNHTVAWKIRNADQPRAWLTGGIVLNLAVLGGFKYADFLLHIVVPPAPVLNIALPLAISFFTFQQIMFLVDTGRGRAHPDRHQDNGLAEIGFAQPNHALTVMTGYVSVGSNLTGLARASPFSSWPGLAPPHGTLPLPASQVVGGRSKPGHDTLARPVLDHVELAPEGLVPGTTGREAAGVCPHHSLDAPGADPRIESADNHGDKETDCAAGSTLGPVPLLPCAAFVTFFPHLIAGPIVRPSDILPQLTASNLAHPNIRNLADGTLIFLLGLGKKLVLADMFGGFADTGFDAAAHGAALTVFEAWYATLSYALQIYFDFSGYSDMAIGLARMFNVRFPPNFDSPYQATNIAAFWRRWHITLGAFLRDYLYIPLGGNRAGKLRQTANLIATMLLAGLWHGAAWNFVIWGGLHGLFLVIHTQYRRLLPPMPGGLAHALTLLAVILAWVPFRAASLSSTLVILRGMAGFNGIALPRMIVSAIPPLSVIADPVAVMPFLGDARTLSFPEVSACLLFGWLIVLALPNVHRMTATARHWALTASFAFSVQALFFAPHVAPFLYFQF
jgi:D-alanyl-lipoteichoic acid acyltransferase DltB (MBOAT superfamily)